jgi:hypothetical protein
LIWAVSSQQGASCGDVGMARLSSKKKRGRSSFFLDR